MQQKSCTLSWTLSSGFLFKFLWLLQFYFNNMKCYVMRVVDDLGKTRKGKYFIKIEYFTYSSYATSSSSLLMWDAKKSEKQLWRWGENTQWNQTRMRTRMCIKQHVYTSGVWVLGGKRKKKRRKDDAIYGSCSYIDCTDGNHGPGLHPPNLWSKRTVEKLKETDQKNIS